MTGSPALDPLVALVPVRGLEAAKARLGDALDAEERRALVERLLRRTVAAALGAPGISGVGVVSSDPEVLAVATAAGAGAIAQGGGGLNDGLVEGRAWAMEGGARSLLVIPGDLPAVSAAELGRIVAGVRALAGSGATNRRTAIVALVTDRGGEGTNLLLLAPPDVIPFRFGPGSRALHAAAARAAGAIYLELDGPLTLDLDTPDDLLVAEAAGLGALRAELS